jgi:predicted transcriptional regulator
MNKEKEIKYADYDTKNTNRVLKYLKESVRGLTITDIATALNLNRHTVTKILDRLLIEKRVNYDEKGAAKIFYYTGDSKFVGKVEQGNYDTLWFNVFKPNYPGEEEFIRINQMKHDHLSRSSSKFKSVGAIAIKRKSLINLIRILRDVARDEMGLKI